MSFEDICERLKTLMLQYFIETDKIIDNVVTDDSTKVLSAKQGLLLDKKINEMKTIVIISSEVKICEEENVPMQGYHIGDKYIEFITKGDEENTSFYLLLTEFIPPINNMEIIQNKIITIDSSSTNTEYPSAKAVYDLFNSIIDFDEELY